MSGTFQENLIYEFTDFCIKDDSTDELAAVSALSRLCGTLYIFPKRETFK